MNTLSDNTAQPDEVKKKIGPLDTDPEAAEKQSPNLTPQQQALRDAAINNFKANKIKAYIANQVEYINTSRQIGDGIRFLLDKNGRPPANAPMEDIIEERKKIEAQIRWLEAICSELRLNLSKLREIEDEAFELLKNKEKK